MLLMLVFNIFYNKNKKRTIHLVFIIAAILFTQTRSAWLSVVLLFLILALSNVKKINFLTFRIKKSTITVVYICLFIIFVLFWEHLLDGLIYFVFNRFEKLGDSVSLEQRSITNINIINISNIITTVFTASLWHTLFGFGHEQSVEFMLNNVAVIKDFTTTDVGWVAMLYNYGLITILFCIIFYVNFCRILLCV